MTQLAAGDKLVLDGEVVTVVAITGDSQTTLRCVVEAPDGSLRHTTVLVGDVARLRLPVNDGRGDPDRLLTGLWAKWMEWAIPHIRSTVTATRPLKPFAHQDEAVFGKMLPQPRLRFLLADEPGTGKTIMTGMYVVEGRRRGLIPGKVLVVVPAHLVEKWLRDLRRYFGIEAMRITSEIGREPQSLRPDINVWVVSVDLFTHNPDVHRKAAGQNASWSLAVFDEAHRLTPTSQYLEAARRLSHRTHHLLLLTATPHRGKEDYFRALLNLLDPGLYPADAVTAVGGPPLRPGELSFLRRMKEDLRDLEGNPLFPARFAETCEVTLSAREEDAYTAVMAYVDEWYGANAVLARSIYGKRAASSAVAARETLRRRSEALQHTPDVEPRAIAPLGFDDARFAGADLADDASWDEAERSVIEANSRDRRRELRAIENALEVLQRLTDSGEEPSKWAEAERLLRRHGIQPGSGQLLVFTEFTDSARWLAGVFQNAGFSVEILDGSADHLTRDDLQQRFVAGRFQVLVSTDAGGEGIDLQSAHVMLNWDIPWSLVRLEQRMGRLHRIGQTEDVYIYHLVAPATREGRVQQVMLQNIELAARALRGRIFDLLDAAASGAGFDYASALAEAQRGDPISASAMVAQIPDAEQLIATASEIVRDEDRFRSESKPEEALRRFANDRLQAINPVMVTEFLRQLGRAEGWEVGPGPFPGILRIHASRILPQSLGGGRTAFAAADGEALERAKAGGFRGASDVHVLGPTEEAFQSLVAHAATSAEQDLSRGGRIIDAASLTSYTLFLFAADVETHDGIRTNTVRLPFLIRYSGQGAFKVAWESILNLVRSDSPAARPVPAAWHEAATAADEWLRTQERALSEEKLAWVDQAKADLDTFEVRYRSQLKSLPLERRREQAEHFLALKVERLRQLDRVSTVRVAPPTLLGWVQVDGGSTPSEASADPDSEGIAIHLVVAELERNGFMVDDRQTAGLGYDLYARHERSHEQRLVEVKGLMGGLGPVTFERHEWAQAQQRGSEYWLYVVTDCGSRPVTSVRIQDPARALINGPRSIERFRVPVSELRRFDVR